MKKYILFGIILGIIGFIIGYPYLSILYALIGSGLGMFIGSYFDYYHVINSLGRIKRAFQKIHENNGDIQIKEIVHTSGLLHNDAFETNASFALYVYTARVPGMLEYLIRNGDPSTKQYAFWIADQYVNLCNSLLDNYQINMREWISAAYVAQRSFETLLADTGKTFLASDFVSSNNLAAAFISNSKVEKLLERFQKINRQYLMMAKINMAMARSYHSSYASTTGGIDFKKQIVKDDIRHELAKDNIYL